MLAIQGLQFTEIITMFGFENICLIVAQQFYFKNSAS